MLFYFWISSSASFGFGSPVVSDTIKHSRSKNAARPDGFVSVFWSDLVSVLTGLGFGASGSEGEGSCGRTGANAGSCSAFDLILGTWSVHSPGQFPFGVYELSRYLAQPCLSIRLWSAQRVLITVAPSSHLISYLHTVLEVQHSPESFELELYDSVPTDRSSLETSRFQR